MQNFEYLNLLFIVNKGTGSMMSPENKFFQAIPSLKQHRGWGRVEDVQTGSLCQNKNKKLYAKTAQISIVRG